MRHKKGAKESDNKQTATRRQTPRPRHFFSCIYFLRA